MSDSQIHHAERCLAALAAELASDEPDFVAARPLLDDLRVAVRYICFDAESLKRENEYFRKALRERGDG